MRNRDNQRLVLLRKPRNNRRYINKAKSTFKKKLPAGLVDINNVNTRSAPAALYGKLKETILKPWTEAKKSPFKRIRTVLKWDDERNGETEKKCVQELLDGVHKRGARQIQGNG